MTKRAKPKQRDTVRAGTYREKTNLHVEHLGEVVSIRILFARDGRARLSIRFMPLPPERRPPTKLERALMLLTPDARKDISEMLACPWWHDVAIDALREDGYDVC